MANPRSKKYTSPRASSLARGGRPANMNKTQFDQRREHSASPGLPSELLKDAKQVEMTAVADQELAPLLDLPETISCILKDRIPIPATIDREGYYDNRHLSYWLSGYHDYLSIMRSIPEASRASCILDFGGASGRLARHFVTNSSESCRIVVADLNINHVDYIAKYFPHNVVALKLSSYPHIMIPDSSCDLICAISVFTHIDTYEFSWLSELSRILRSKGFAYVTLHTEHTWDLLPNAFVIHTLRKNKLFNCIFRPGEPMPGDRLVFEYKPESHDYSCNVFHHSEYLKRQWSRSLSIAKIEPYAHAYQTAVTLQKA